ncbi:hypothetical protein JTB14_010613 [Gonioctena quinquepunctata]|nr:hypothetical protein JTB14_010613 [Gonioctena quinquepunctata]
MEPFTIPSSQVKKKSKSQIHNQSVESLVAPAKKLFDDNPADFPLDYSQIVSFLEDSFGIPDPSVLPVLHVIDEMLDPVITSPKFSPNAYDFLSSYSNWNLGAAKTVSNFFTKVQENKVNYIYKQNAGLTRGNYGEGEFYSEVVVPNIPVKNGVIHVISEPLGIFNRKLKPFPYLPVFDKMSTDPSLEVFYNMGARTGFNDIFSKEGVNFTYLVPNDSAWMKAKQNGLETMDSDLNILGRHLIISQTPYSIEQLHSLTKARNYTDIEMNTQAGPLRIMVVKIEDDYYLKWYNSPLTNFRKITKYGSNGENGDTVNLENVWKAVRNVWKKIV